MYEDITTSVSKKKGKSNSDKKRRGTLKSTRTIEHLLLSDSTSLFSSVAVKHDGLSSQSLFFSFNPRSIHGFFTGNSKQLQEHFQSMPQNASQFLSCLKGFVPRESSLICLLLLFTVSGENEDRQVQQVRALFQNQFCLFFNDILHTIYYIIYTLYYILHIIYYILYTYYILHPVYYILHTIYNILYSTYYILNTIYYIVYITYYILDTIYHILYTIYYLLYTIYYIVYSTYYILHTIQLEDFIFSVFLFLFFFFCLRAAVAEQLGESSSNGLILHYSVTC